MTKMTAMVKNLKKSSPELMKLGMKHLGLVYYYVYVGHSKSNAICSVFLCILSVSGDVFNF